MINRARGRLTLAVVVLVGMTVAACGGEEGDGAASAPAKQAAAESGPVKFGVALAETGPAAATDASYKTGLEAAVKWINDNGGVLGGRRLEPVFRDTGGDPTKGAAAIRELAGDDELAFMVLDPVSPVALAQAPALNQTGVPAISMAASPEVTDAERNPWVFSFGEDSNQTAEEAVRYLAETAGIKKLGMIYENNPFGQGASAASEPLFSKYGAELVGKEGFQTGTANVTAQLRKLRDAGAEGLVIWTYGPGLAAVAQGRQSLDWHPESTTVPGVALPVIADAVGGREKLKGLNGYGIGKTMLAPEEGGSPDPKAREFLDSLPAGYDGDIVQPSWMFDAVRVFAAALEKAGSTEPDKLKAALESGEGFEGLRSTFKFTADDHAGVDIESIGLFRGDAPCTVESGCVAAPGVL
jgi:branched-chain amino acid transport system substrate-binding protein